MNCVVLKGFPSPLPGKAGWPWADETPCLPDTMPDGSPWPRVSIVTPSYNQGQFIEETIRSVLLQGYPSLEYIVMDGGSTDGAEDIIRKYEPWLSYVHIGPDGGQAAAIADGFLQAMLSVMADMDATDTAHGVIIITGGANQMYLSTDSWLSITLI